MPGTIQKRRILSCALVVAATLEVCCRLEDWFRHGVPLADSYDMNVLFTSDAYGLIGKPNSRFEKFTLNRWGYRGPEPREGTVRILCLGASETFGVYEDEGKEFPRQLEAQLNRRLGTSAIEVVNVSVPGTNLARDRPRLPAAVELIHPQFAVLYPSYSNFGWAGRLHLLEMRAMRPQSIQPANTVVPSPPGPSQPSLRHFAGRVWRRTRRALVNTYRSVKRRLGDGAAPQPSRFRIARKWLDLWNWLLPTPMQERWVRAVMRWDRWRTGISADSVPKDTDQYFHAELTEAVAFLQSRGVTVLLAQHADRFRRPPSEAGDGRLLSLWNSYYLFTTSQGLLDLEDRLNSVMADVADARGVSLIDPRKTIPKDARYFGDATHFTNEGSKMMAELLADELRPKVQKVLTIP